MSVSVLPNGKSQFIDLNGAPLVGGFVYHFVLDTDTPKDTWQDPNQDALNSNPIVLDERGQASIWGTGMYRQRVLDSLGNLVWDEPTEAPCGCGGESRTLPVADEGVPITTDALSFNFVGDGVTATADGSGNVTVTVPASATVAWQVGLSNDIDVPIDNGWNMNGGLYPTFDLVGIDTHDAIDLSFDYGALPDGYPQSQFYSPSTVWKCPEGQGGVYVTTFTAFLQGPDQDNVFAVGVTHLTATGAFVGDDDGNDFSFNTARVNLAPATGAFDNGLSVSVTAMLAVEEGEYLLPWFQRAVNDQDMTLDAYTTSWLGYRVGPSGPASFYEATLSFYGTPDASQIVMLWPFAQSVTFTANFGGFQPEVITPPSVSIDFPITRINADGSSTSIGTMSIATDGTVSIVTVASPVFAGATAMKIAAPANLHGLADFAVTFLGFPT